MASTPPSAAKVAQSPDHSRHGDAGEVRRAGAFQAVYPRHRAIAGIGEERAHVLVFQPAN